MKLKELAARINAHLKRFEADPAINTVHERYGTSRFYHAGAGYYRGRYIEVTYVRYQGPINITKDEAIRYLEKLDAGFVGQHFEALRE